MSWVTWILKVQIKHFQVGDPNTFRRTAKKLDPPLPTMVPVYAVNSKRPHVVCFLSVFTREKLVRESTREKLVRESTRFLNLFF